MRNKHQQYLTHCTECGANTSKKFAREHNGRCKACCNEPSAYNDTPTRNERIIDNGYQAYAREEGHYDTGDN